MNEEEYLRFQLGELQKSYQKAAQPLLDRLCAIERLKLPPPMILTIEQARSVGLIPPEQIA